MNKRILIADDDHKILELVKVMLESKGYSVIQAADGQEALEKTRLEKPDLLILDVTMPKLDGDEVYMTLRSDPATKKLPILTLTGLRSDKEIEAAQDENMFAKPVQFEKLFFRMKEILGE